MWLFCYFIFEKNYDALKSKSSCILLKNILTLIKAKQNWKLKIPHTLLERRTFYFSSYKNRKLKVEIWWVEAPKRKKRTFFVPFILPKAIFFNICVLSCCIVYWIHFQNMPTFTHRKTLVHTLFLLAFKIAESIQCILNNH